MQTGILVRIHNQSLSRSTVTGAVLQPDLQPVAAASHSLQPATPAAVFVKESHIFFGNCHKLNTVHTVFISVNINISQNSASSFKSF
jgi:hypothetical protein